MCYIDWGLLVGRFIPCCCWNPTPSIFCAASPYKKLPLECGDAKKELANVSGPFRVRMTFTLSYTGRASHTAYWTRLDL